MTSHADHSGFKPLRVLAVALTVALMVLLGGIGSAGAVTATRPTGAALLASGLHGSIGATIGPDGALYVAEGAIGQITRIDPRTGHATPYATGLPGRTPGVPFGGVMDVAFIGKTAYVLVTLSPDAASGIYQVNGSDPPRLVADIGAWSLAHPPTHKFDYTVPTGVQFALQPIRGGFLVTDGHLNRVLKVTLDGRVSELIGFDDVVPTGLEVRGSTVYVSEVGPVPVAGQPLPAGKVVSFDRRRSCVPRQATVVAAGSNMTIDVEYGPHGTLYALSQGVPAVGIQPADAAMPNTGQLLRVNHDGTFSVIVDGLNQPTSLDFVGDTAYIVGLQGDVWKVKHVSKI
jgi:hypothetical protein